MYAPDPTDPDTASERNRRALIEWRHKMRTHFDACDPLTIYERACANYYLARARVRMRDWLRNRPGARRPRVVPFRGRRP